ncbi:hypothetical protein INT47_001192 [Mucor saturninus]|uniref:Uncharacterized protein n=1 Tax=Mucor saturninus TaxID=64648 RepID=A0A8H7VEW3_9FUNG|nr:hypothetical protein INT47_001192 [Mucor saturninus]
MNKHEHVSDLNDTAYAVHEPLPVSPTNGYKTAEEVTNVLKECRIPNKFSIAILRNEFNETHKRLHVACKYSGLPDKRTLGANSKRLHSTFKTNCPYIIKTSFTKKVGGYKIMNADVPGNSVHNHPLDFQSMKITPEFKKTLITENGLVAVDTMVNADIPMEQIRKTVLFEGSNIHKLTYQDASNWFGKTKPINLNVDNVGYDLIKKLKVP